MILNCKISDIAYYLPETVVDNSKLASRYTGWDEDKIYEKTGIRKRHVVRIDEHVSDLAVNAALRLFEGGDVGPEEIDLLVLCTQTPDYALPATASLIHERLGLSDRCATFDFNQGCTGFIYGLSIVGSMIHCGLAKKALLITAETYSRWCHPMDKSVTTIFGDGAAATYIRSVINESGTGPFVFGTDGKGFQNLIVPLSGSHGMQKRDEADKEATDGSGNIRKPSNIYMNGPELFRFAISAVPSMVRDLLYTAKKNIDDIDKFVFHQANVFMLKSIQKILKISDEKMIYKMEDIGNTVSSSIPIAIVRAYEEGIISPGDQLLLAGFGVGYSWGGTILTWKPETVKT
jgi:3-oxoacyl-[acyl-carrier-protein] synthase III